MHYLSVKLENLFYQIMMFILKNILYVINNKTIFPELIIDKETKEIKTLIKLKYKYYLFNK